MKSTFSIVGRSRPLTARAMASASAPKKVIVVGGVAGGASCAARLRRLSEDVEITIFEKGPYVSFANCGLPYAVGDVIKEESKLLVANAAKFNNWFNIDVKESTEVIKVDPAGKTVVAKDVNTGEEKTYSYDKLVLSPGAAAIKPPLPGVDLPGVFPMKTIPDVRKVKDWIAKNNVKNAVVVGAGFIGMEMAENLHLLGIHVTLLEMGPQVMPPLDPEMVEPLHAKLRADGVNLVLGDGVAGFEAAEGGGLSVSTGSGQKFPAELVMLVIGVKPESKLAVDAGLKVNQRGGIVVDEHMCTSDPNIYAVGDAVEVKDLVTGAQTMVPLAGPANRQGRIAANALMGASPDTFRGVQATSVVGAFGLTLASTGASEKGLKRAGIPYKKVYLHAANHAGYYPGAFPIDIKLLFTPDEGKILGMQAVGEGEGVEKRVDVAATFMQMGGTVFDMEEAELCYAPQYGSAKDPINMAGMVAANLLRGFHPISYWDSLEEIQKDPNAVLIDVRNPDEYAQGTVPGAVNMPLPKLRGEAIASLAKDKKYYVFCQVGLRGYMATRQFVLAGLDVTNITGGYKTFQQYIK